MKILNSHDLELVNLKSNISQKKSIFDSEKFADLKTLEVGQGLLIKSDELSAQEYKSLNNGGSAVYHYFKLMGKKASRRTTTDGNFVIIRVA